MKIATVGEVMIEIISEMPQPNETKVYETSTIQYGGPVINTAWYGQLLGHEISPFAFVGHRDENQLRQVMNHASIDIGRLLSYDGHTDMIISMTTKDSHFSHYYRSTFPSTLLDKLQSELDLYDAIVMNGSRHAELLRLYEQLVLNKSTSTIFNPGYSIYEIKDLKLLRFLILESEIVTLNELETQHVKKVLSLDFEDDSFQNQNIIVLTQGHKGSTIFSQGQRYSFGSLTNIERDVIGAGDAYISAFLCHYYKSRNLPASMEIATACAGIVVEEGSIRSRVSLSEIEKRVQSF